MSGSGQLKTQNSKLRTYLKHVASFVHAVHSPQPIADLAHCGVGFDSLNQRRQHVFVGARLVCQIRQGLCD